jgi:plastocyanin
MRRLLAAVCVIASGVFVAGAPASAGGGGCHEGRTTGEGSAVRIFQACFGPTVLRVAPGTTVTFTNDDDMLHALSGTGLDYHELSAGDRVEQAFLAPGVYPYMCHLHPGMSGAVVVGDAAAPVLAGATRERTGASWGLFAAAIVMAAALGFVVALRAGNAPRRRHNLPM